MNKILFKQKMIENGDTQTILANAMGIPQSALSARINGKIDFRQTEMDFIRKRYRLSGQDTVDIFFEERVS